jgi:predicted lipoprotein
VNRRVRVVFLLCAASAGFAGCFNQPFDQEGMLQSLGSDVIIPGYESFSEQTDALVVSARAFCDSPTTPRLGELQSQWKESRNRWKRMDAINFGPYAEAPWRLGPKIDSWPVRESTVDENLAGEDPLNLETVRALGAASRGLPAMEYLIFDPAGSGVALAKFEGSDGGRRCDYVIALAEDLRESAEAMVEAWSPDGDDYLGALLASGEPGAPFMSIRDASNEIVNRMVFLVENIMRLKVAKPLGLESGGEPRPDEVESPYSDHSLEDILANLDGLESIYRGRYGDRRGVGIQSWLRWGSAPIDIEMIAAMITARSAVEDISEPLSRAVEIEPALVQTAYDQLRALRNTIGVDVINGLSGSVTFNDTDGD